MQPSNSPEVADLQWLEQSRIGQRECQENHRDFERCEILPPPQASICDPESWSSKRMTIPHLKSGGGMFFLQINRWIILDISEEKQTNWAGRIYNRITKNKPDLVKLECLATPILNLADCLVMEISNPIPWSTVIDAWFGSPRPLMRTPSGLPRDPPTSRVLLRICPKVENGQRLMIPVYRLKLNIAILSKFQRCICFWGESITYC